MKCYFLRHGIAVEPDEWAGSDFDRPLTREGRQRLEREAKAIAALDFGFDRIVTSPLLRAKQTAEILADRLGLRERLVEDTRLGGGFSHRRLGEILAAHSGAEAIVLVGHEPAMSATIGRAIGDARVEMKKAALAGIEFAASDASAGTLVCLIPPRVLATLGKR